jgi:hypothetical protein
MTNSGAIPVPFQRNQVIPVPFLRIPVPFRRNPAELPDSGRNLWGTEKYSTDGCRERGRDIEQRGRDIEQGAWGLES